MYSPPLNGPFLTPYAFYTKNIHHIFSFYNLSLLIINFFCIFVVYPLNSRYITWDKHQLVKLLL